MGILGDRGRRRVRPWTLCAQGLSETQGQATPAACAMSLFWAIKVSVTPEPEGTLQWIQGN